MDYYRHKLYLEEIKQIAGNLRKEDLFTGKTIVVTGARGLIGSELIDVVMYANTHYGLNCNIYANIRQVAEAKKRFAQYLDCKNFVLCKADLNMDEFCVPEDVDYVIHAASNTHPFDYAQKPIETILTNTVGTNHMLKFAVEHRCKRFIFLSSVEVYGKNRGDIEAFAEDYCGDIDCNTLRAGYPESKRTGEALCQAYGSEKKLDCVIARLARCYGPGLLPQDTKAVSQFLQKAACRNDIILKSEGKQYYSYIYAADAADAILFLVGHGENGEAYNIKGKNSDSTLRRLAEMAAHLAGTKVIYQVPEKVEAAGYSKAEKAILNAEKIDNLGWRAKVSLKEGMERTFKIQADRGDILYGK